MAANEKSKERLLSELKDEITFLFEQTLDYVQVACPRDNYTALRSKILRVGNNCIRNMRRIAQHYDIEFIPSAEEVIEVKQPKIINKK